MAINEFDSEKFLVTSVNILLQSIGEPPIETLEDVSQVLEASIAQDNILESKRAILAERWDVNTDENYPFIPDLNGFISIPTTVLDLSSNDNIIVRDWMLYNKTDHTRIFEDKVLCNVTWNLDFNNLPHPLRHYITLHAARKFQARMITDTNVYSFTNEEMNQAKINAKRSNGYTKHFNILTNIAMKSL